MNTRTLVLFGLLLVHPFAVHAAEDRQFILINASRNSQREAFDYVGRAFNSGDRGRVRVGVGGIFSYLQHPREETIRDLQSFLEQAQRHDAPVIVQLDGENWWGNRPELWNWWDPSRPGYSTSNRWNVEWKGWSPDDAVKIAWRNWGRQIRVLPPPNLMSPAYRTACHEEMRVLIPIVLKWHDALPGSKKHLLVGIKLGWETSIGVNAWHYPGGNDLLERPASEDPTSGIVGTEPPARGVTQIGYAAVKTAGIRDRGQITEADLAEVARRHLEDLCRLAAELKVPRELVFTHVAGWKEKELLYQAGLNSFSCPGWSFYQHAANPAGDPGVQDALKRSDAPFWAAVEWLYQGPREFEPWRKALGVVLNQPRCRYVCIYNWDGIHNSPEILRAIAAVARESNSRVANQSGK